MDSIYTFINISIIDLTK